MNETLRSLNPFSNPSVGRDLRQRVDENYFSEVLYSEVLFLGMGLRRKPFLEPNPLEIRE